MPDCIFCRIVADEIPSVRVYENERALVFMDINPLTRGHSLAIPKAHCNDIFDMGEEDAKAVMLAAKKVSLASLNGLGASGVNLLNSNRRAAGQEVMHYHIHIVPRYEGDGLRLFPVQRYRETDIKATCEKIKSGL